MLVTHLCQVTTWSRALCGSITGAKLVKKFPVFIVHKDHYHLNKISHSSVSWDGWIRSISSHSICLRSSIYHSLLSDLHVFWHNFVCISPSTKKCCMSCPSCPLDFKIVFLLCEYNCEAPLYIVFTTLLAYCSHHYVQNTLRRTTVIYLYFSYVLAHNQIKYFQCVFI